MKLFVSVFSSDGSLKKRVPLNGEGTRASNGEIIASMSVVRPMTVKSRGRIFVLRGSTRDPVYVFSDSGELTGTVSLQASNVEFSSPKIFGNQLIVHQHRLPLPSGSVLKEPELETFPVFDLDSGLLVEQFEWRSRGELACYDQDGLTLMQHGLDYPDRGYYAMINAQPMPKESAPSRPPATAIKLELYWIVSCTDATRSLPLRDDDAASRYCLSEHSIVDQDDVESASAYVDDLDQLGMRLSFTPDGSEKLSRATTAKNDAELGLVIDGDLVLKALVREPLEHEAIITGAGLHKDQLLDWVERLSLNSEVRKRALKKGT